MKNFSFKDYCLDLSSSVVADSLLEIAHVLCQISLCAYMVVWMIRPSMFLGLLGRILLGCILIIVFSIIIRFFFEFLASIFAISKNILIIRESICFDECVCDSCGENCNCVEGNYCECGEDYTCGGKCGGKKGECQCHNFEVEGSVAVKNENVIKDVNVKNEKKTKKLK